METKSLRIARALLLVVLLAAAALSLLTGSWAGVWYDTPSYFEAARSLCDGMIDRVRTPLYPALILLLKALTGSEARVVEALRWVQWGVFLLSVGAVGCGGRRLFGPGKAAFAATALYALYPAFWVYNDLILTESLSVSLTAFLLVSLVEAPRSRGARIAVWLVMGLLLMLRPAMICYLPVVAVSLLALPACRRSALVGTAAMALLLGGYMALMHHTYGFARLTTVSATNTFATLRLNGLISPSDYSDPYTRASLTYAFERSDSVPTLEQWGDENLTLMLLLGPQGYVGMIDEAAARYRSRMPACVAARVATDLPGHPFFDYRRFFWRYLPRSPWSPPLLWGAVALAVAGIIVVGRCIVCRRRPGVAFYLVGLPAAAMVTAIVGAQGEFTRLFAPAMPAVFLLAVWLVRRTRIAIKMS